MPKKGKESDGINHWREWDSEDKRSKSTLGEEECVQWEKGANKERKNKQGQLPSPSRETTRSKERKAGRLNANLCHINSILWV